MSVKMSLDEYLGLQGLAFPVDDFMLDKLVIPKGQTVRQEKRMHKEAQQSSDDYHRRRNDAIREYYQKVENGEIVEPTFFDKTIKTASGHPDNPSVQAAIRILKKRGYIKNKKGEWVKKMNIPINNEDLKKALIVAKSIIDEEEFELVVVNNPKSDTKEYLFYEENGFYLQDATGTNLGGIESERFATLADVIDRLDIYHNDYFWEADCDRTADELDPVNYDLENVAFLESDYCAELLSQITPAKYDELAYEGALELGHNSKTWSDNIRYLLNKEIAYKIIETQSAYVMCEYNGKVYLSDYDTYTDADRMLKDVVYARGDKYYHLGDTTTAFCRYNGERPEYCFNEYQSFFDVIDAEGTQVLEDIQDIGLTENGAWSFYLSPKELMIAGVPYENIKKALEHEKELENSQSDCKIYEVCFDDDNYMHFNVNADGYSLDGLFRVHDDDNGREMTIVSIDYGYMHPSIKENWNDIERQCRMAALEKYTEITGKQYVFENTKDEPDITDDM